MDPDVINFAKATREKESGGNFNARGKSGESGAYQWMPDTWRAQAQDILGDGNAQMTPDNQQAVAYGTFKKWKDAGLNPAQMAAKWNSGSENGWENKVGVNSYGVEYNVPAYVKGVTDIYHRNKSQGGVVQPIQISQGNGQENNQTREQLIQQKQPVSVNPEKDKPTIGGQIIRGLISPFVRGFNTLSGVGDKLEGGDPKQHYNKYLGDVTGYGMKEGQTKSQQVKDVIGGALELGSFFIPGGKAIGTAAKIAKGAKPLLTGALKAGALGAVSGAGSGAGIELQDPNSTAGSVSASGGVGALTGGVLGAGGALAPKLVKGASRGIKSGTEKAQMISGIVTGKPSKKAIKTAQNSMAKEWDRIKMALPMGVRKNQDEILKRTGSNAFTELSRLGIIPDQVGGKYDIAGADEALEAHLKAANSVLEKVKQNETALFDIDDAFNKSLQKIDDLDIDVREKEKMAQNLRAFFDSNVKHEKIGENGHRFISAAEAVRMKRVARDSAGFSSGATSNVKAQKIMESPFYDFARNIDETVDKNATIPQFKKANEFVSKLLGAKSILREMQERPIRTAGGFTGKLTRKLTTTGAGFGMGNIVGAILGNLTGDAVEQFYTNPKIRTLVSKKIMEGMNKNIPVEQLAQEIEQVIQQRATSAVPPIKSNKTVGLLEKYRTKPPVSDIDKVKNAISEGKIQGNKGVIKINE